MNIEYTIISGMAYEVVYKSKKYTALQSGINGISIITNGKCQLYEEFKKEMKLKFKAIWKSEKNKKESIEEYNKLISHIDSYIRNKKINSILNKNGEPFIEISKAC
jgi:hypothetical protein